VISFNLQLENACRFYIPCSTKIIQKQSHPWLDDACSEAIQRKESAEGTTDYAEARASCATILHDSYGEYVRELRREIACLPKGSKRWWLLNREFLKGKARCSSIPSLRVTDGT
jgi:hypothetical protein